MIFQQLHKNLYFYNGNFYNNIDNTCKYTWEYSPYFNNVEFLEFYCQCKTISDVCPEHLKKQWNVNLTKLKNYNKSLKTAKLCVNKEQYYKIIPENVLNEHFSLKENILNYVLENYKKPDYYNLLLSIQKIIYDISKRNVNIDYNLINKEIFDSRVKSLKNKIIENHRILYKNFGSITGRLSTKKHSFPILTLDKKFRKFIKPNNGWFFEVDYNAAEIRVFLGLNGQEQPDIDIHDYHNKFYKFPTREEAKNAFFSWFYGEKESSGVKEIDNLYDKKTVLNKFWNTNMVKTPYGVEIEADYKHALSYLVQSTTWSVFSESVINIFDFLKNKNIKSNIFALIHDSCIIDLHPDDEKYLKDILSIFSKTRFGNFSVSSKIGENLGNLEIVNV